MEERRGEEKGRKGREGEAGEKCGPEKQLVPLVERQTDSAEQGYRDDLTKTDAAEEDEREDDLLMCSESTVITRVVAVSQ